MKQRKKDIVLIGFVFLLVFGNLFSGPLSNPEEKIAIVCFLEGKAWVSESDKKERSEIALFDWMDAKAVIETGSGTKLILAFSSGDRYELKEKAKATLGKDGFTSLKGSVEKLAPVPVMPQIVSISKEARPGSRLGGIRLRGAKRFISGLYPSEGAKVLAEKAVLTFEPIEGVEKYRVEIEDEWGNNIFSIETASHKVVASPGVLNPGANYYWQVRTQDRDTPSIFGEAIFTTVTEENARMRNSLKSIVDQSKDVANILLLAQMDISLGLLREACETLKSALALFPDNSGIKNAIAKFNCK